MRWVLPFCLLLAACSSIPRPQKGGAGAIVLPDGSQVVLQQPENPKGTSKQRVVYTVSELPCTPAPVVLPQSDQITPDVTSAPVRTLTIEHEISATQEDTSRKLGVMLQSLKGVRMIGALMILLGVGIGVAGMKMGWGWNGTIGGVAVGGAGTAMIAISVWLPQVPPVFGLLVLVLAVACPVVALAYYKGHGDAKG